jgi:hypothetical protein
MDSAASSQHIGTKGVTVHLGVDFEFFDLLTTSASFGTNFVGDDSSFNRWSLTRAGTSRKQIPRSALTISALSAGLRTPEYCFTLVPERNIWTGA